MKARVVQVRSRKGDKLVAEVVLATGLGLLLHKPNGGLVVQFDPRLYKLVDGDCELEDDLPPIVAKAVVEAGQAVVASVGAVTEQVQADIARRAAEEHARAEARKGGKKR
jgi:hypothetical protein